MVNNSRFFVHGQELTHAGMWYDRQSLAICYWGRTLSVTAASTAEEGPFGYPPKKRNAKFCPVRVCTQISVRRTSKFGTAEKNIENRPRPMAQKTSFSCQACEIMWSGQNQRSRGQILDEIQPGDDAQRLSE